MKLAADGTGSRAGGGLALVLLVVLLACTPHTLALDACLTKPWQADLSLTKLLAPTPVSLSSWQELQEHIDAAVGPATFVLRATQTPLIADQPLRINQSAITIVGSADWLSYVDGRVPAAGGPGAAALPARQGVACSDAAAGALLRVERASGVRLVGFHLSGCSGSAIQLDTAKRVVLRGCLFNANSNNTSGGAVDAIRSQLWVDSCMFQANSASGGSGGAISASYSHLLVSDSSFSSNSAGVSGGAVAMRGRSTDAAAAAAAAGATCWKDTDAVLVGPTFNSNRAKLHGGAVAINGTHMVLQAAVANQNKARYGGVAYQGQTAQLTVRGNSLMANNTATSSGGVVYAVSPGARLLMSSSSFSNNQAKILGGVVSAKEAASVRLDDCQFSNNTADLAAGVVYARDADMTATGCTFSTNSAKRDGGALYCAGGCVWKLRSCAFRDNECGANGGAIFGWNVEASISSSTMAENSAGALGGGVAVANSTLELKSCKLSANNAYGSDAAGGGLYSQGSQLNLTDCYMGGNVASWGGAVYITNSSLALTGGGIANSTAAGSGAALYVLRSGITVTNTSLQYNNAQQYAGSMYCIDSACALVGCDILGDSAVQGGGCIWVGRGSLSLRRSHIVGCVSAADGGGAVHAAAAASVVVSGCSFKGCSALKGSGGALWLSGVRSVGIRGSLFAQNQARFGGSLYISNSSATVSSSSIMNSTATVGGGVAATAGSELTLFNNTVVAGNAAAVGGGVAVDSTHLSLTGPVTVSWNKAMRPTLSGAAITTPAAAAAAAADAVTAAAAAAVSPSTVFGGQAVLRGLGGGLYAHNSRLLGSELRLERNTADRVGAGAYLDRCGTKLISSNISRNQAAEQAGGLKLLNPAQGSALLNVTVSSNWAGLKGGGLAMVGVDLASEVALVDVNLLNNSASGQAGGGLWLSGPLGLLMVGGEVSGNTAGASAVASAAAAGSEGTASNGDADLEAAGGGILLQDCSWAALRGVGIYGNAALAGCGGGLALSGCGKVILSSSTVLGNVAGSGGGVCAVDLLSFLTLANSTISSNRVLLGGMWDADAASLAALSPTPEPHLHCGIQGTGGGLCVSSLGEVLINGSTISRNQARNGGAMALGLCSDGEKCSLGLVGARFLNNTAVQGGGGAVYFSSAVSPYQVRCGDDYKASSITGFARGTSFPSLASLLDSAAFLHSGGSSSAAGASNSSSSSGAAVPGASGIGGGSSSTTAPGSSSSSSSVGINEGVDTVSPAPSGGSSSSTEEEILASTPGSQGSLGGSSGSSSATATPGAADTSLDSSGAAGGTTYTFDSVDAAGSSPDTTTVSFGSVDDSSMGAQVAGMGPAASAAADSSVTQSVGGVAQAESAKIGEGVTAAPADGMSSSTSRSSGPAGSSSGGDADEDIQASTTGYIPPGMFTIASVPEIRPSAQSQPASRANGSLAAYQAKSASIAAGLLQQQKQQQNNKAANSSVAVAAAAAAGSKRHRSHQRAFEAQLPGASLSDATSDGTALAAVAGASAADSGADSDGAGGSHASDDGKLDWELADASEGLRVMPAPQHRGNGHPANPNAANGGQGAVAAAQPVGASTTNGAPTSRSDVAAAADQQLGLGSRPQYTEATARTLAVPVTLNVLQAAEKAGVHPKVTTAWQRVGTVSLGTLLDAGVVDPVLLADFWAAYRPSSSRKSSGAASVAAAADPASGSRLTGWQRQFYSKLAVSLSQAAAAKQEGRAAGGSPGVAAALASPTQAQPYAGCDPVQNPAACPVPSPDRAQEFNKAGTQAILHERGIGGSAAGAGSSSSSGAAAAYGRRLVQVEDLVTAAEEAAANMTFMSADITTVGTAPPPSAAAAGASSSGFVLQGSSQCGLFLHNAALGARAYGPVVTSRPAGLRVWGSVMANESTSSILVATGGQLQVQVSVVDVFGGVVTSGAADFIRIRGTLTPPFSTLGGSGKSSGSLLTAASLTAVSAEALSRVDTGREVDDNGVELSGLQQLSTSNGTLILSGLQLSGLPGTNTTLFITASDPSLLPASLPITLTSCSAGYMQLPGQCQLCPVGTFSFTAEEPLCSLCPVGASCNGTLLVPLAGYWQSTPRSAQVHACLNPAACARDALRQQQLADWQATHFGRGAIVGKSKDALAHELDTYMSDQCAPGYTGRMCGVCTQDPPAIASNSMSHGMVGGACVACGERKAAIGTFVLVRAFDLFLWALLTFLACKAANAWAQAVTLNPATAAATAGSLPPSSAAAAGSSNGRQGSRGGIKGELVLASSAAAAAAVAEVPVSAVLHAHVSVFMDYLQLLSVISASAASYAWPRLLKTFMAAFAFVPLGTSRWVSAECLLPYTLSYRHSIVGLLLTAALPLLYLMSSAAVWILGLFRGKTHRAAIMALVVGTGLFYPLITMSALSVFSCHALDDSKAALPGEQLSAVGSYWTLDPELKCYSGQHLQLTLGFGLPVVLLVVFAWPLLLASMLWDSRFRIRDQQMHPATRRRYLVRKTIKMCHQILGVMSGFVRPTFYLWPVVAEVRKLLLCVVVVLVAGSPAPVQLYVLWSLVAALLVIEWWARPGVTWPIVGLQLVALGAVQGVLYLASAFTQVSLVGSAATFSGLIITLCCTVAVAFLLSLIAAFRANTWLTKALDVDKDGKVSRHDLLVSASKLLHFSQHDSSPHSPPHDKDGDPSSDSKSVVGGDGLVRRSGSRTSAVWKGAVLFFSKRRMIAVAEGGVVAAAQDGGAAGDESPAHDQAGSPNPRSGRTTPLGRSPCLVASSLPITHAAASAAEAAAGRRGGGGAAGGGGAEGGVPTSSSIDMGMLAMLRQVHGAGSIQDAAALAAACSSSSQVAAECLQEVTGQQDQEQKQQYVAVDLGQFSNSAAMQRERRQQQRQQQGGHVVNMGRANSLGPPVQSAGRMPLHAYMSVQQWLEQSESDLVHGPKHPDMAAAGGSVDQVGGPLPARLSPGSRVNSMGRSRSLQLSASTPAPQMAALRSSSGSLALQRAQMLHQFQQQYPMEPNGMPAGADSFQQGSVDDLNTLHSVSESDPQQRQQQQQQRQRRRTTGPAAAARVREILSSGAAAGVPEGDDGDGGADGGPSGQAPAVRHQPYYALWSNIASAITGPSGSVDSNAAGRPPAAPSGHSTGSGRGSERQQSSSHSSSRRGVAGAGSSATRSSTSTRGMHSSGFVTGSIGSSGAISSSSRVRQSPFAAASVANAAAAGSGSSKAARLSPFAAGAAAAGAATGSAGSGMSMPAARAASAPDAHAAAAALAAAAAGAPSVNKGRHSSYYSMWQAAIDEVSDPAAAAAASPAASGFAVQQQSDRPGMSAESAATAPPVVLEPRRHKQYIGLWSALAEELGDGPSAVGAATPGPVVPTEVAAAFAAALASSPASASCSTTTTAVGAGSSSMVASSGPQQLSGRANSSSITSSSSQLPVHHNLGPRVRPSPFATMSAAAAVIGGEEHEGPTASTQQQQQQQQPQQRQRHRRRPGRRPRDSAGTCQGSDSD